jgi:RNA polymerase sigma-32 factor
MAWQDTGNATRANAAFVRRNMRAPLLTREREFELARAWRDDGDEEALHTLVASYMRLVVSVATRFRNYGLPLPDLIQEGSVGLMQAAGRFEPDRDVRFSTYATWWIRAAIQDYILRNWSIVRTGTTASQKSLFFNLRRLRAQIDKTAPTAPNDERRQKIADALAINIADVEAMEGRLSGSDQSLNAAYGPEGEEEWQSFLSDDRPGPEETAIAVSGSRRRSEWLHDAMGELDGRERLIINARRLSEDGTTLEDLGKTLGVSKERVRQLEHRAMGKLRTALLRRTDHPGDLMLEA